MKRRVLVVVALLLVLLALIRPTVVHPHVMGYREIDDHNIALQLIGVSPMWRGVTELTETATTVTVGVTEIRRVEYGSGPGDERTAYIALRLAEPLAGRPIIDASSGTEIPRIRLTTDE